MCECYAILDKKDPRYSLWKQVAPNAHIPLKHPVPHRNPHNPDMAFYECDVSRLTEPQKNLIVNLMHKKFKVSKDHIRKRMAKDGLPIRSDNITVVICGLHVRCMM